VSAEPTSRLAFEGRLCFESDRACRLSRVVLGHVPTCAETGHIRLPAKWQQASPKGRVSFQCS
jgi:hypothetical protein